MIQFALLRRRGAEQSADGVYHDVIYGAFERRAKIATMIDDWFDRTGRDVLTGLSPLWEDIPNFLCSATSVNG
jgi:hypothetical protein